MADNNVSKDLCNEKSKTIHHRINDIDKHLKTIATNCLPHIKTDITTTKSDIKYIKLALKEIKSMVKPKEPVKIDKETVMFAFKLMSALIIIIYLLISGNAEKGIETITGMVMAG